MAKGAFRGGANGGGMNANMIRQAQKMQADMLKMQEELESKEYTASAGGGAVTATVSGKHEVLSLDISPDVIDPDDAEMLADMIKGAINEAFRKADVAANENMSKLTGGLNLGGFGL